MELLRSFSLCLSDEPLPEAPDGAVLFVGRGLDERRLLVGWMAEWHPLWPEQGDPWTPGEPPPTGWTWAMLMPVEAA